MDTELQRAMREYWDECKRQKRKHADFFHSPRKYKFTKELSISMHLFQNFESIDGISYDGFKEGGDPPDVEATSSEGEKLGVEITELVSDQAIRAQIQGAQNYYDHALSWTEKNTINAVQEILDKKAPPKRTEHDRYIVLIHTDEYQLTYSKTEPYLRKHPWNKPSNIDEAYLLFSYDPNENGFPVVKLW